MSFTYNDIWLHSYETLIFVGPDVGAIPGDLQSNQYALDGNGTGYYINPKNPGQYHFIHIGLDLKDNAGNQYSLTGLSQVRIAPGHCYFDGFLTAQGATDLYTPTSQYYGLDTSQLPVGDVVRVLTTKALYQAHGTVPNNPQPSRTEMVDVLPPDPPPQPHNEPHSIAFDATSYLGTPITASSYSFSHTCGASANLLVFGDSHSGNDVFSGDVTISGATYNGSAMTYVRSDMQIGTSNYNRSTIYYKYAPPTGSAYTVSVTYTGMAMYACGGVCSYSGVKQSGQPDNSSGATGLSGNPTVNLTTNADNCWVFSVVQIYGSSITGYTNNIRWVNAAYGSGASDTNGVKHPAGSQNMTFYSSQDSSDYWAISAVSFAPITITPAVLDENSRFKIKVGPVYSTANSRFYVLAPLTVSTNTVSSETPTTVTLNGSLLGIYKSSSVSVGFDYGTTTNFGSSIAAVESPMTTTGTFHANLTGLTPGTVYYVRAKITQG